jgi:SEC-C motif domain protein
MSDQKCPCGSGASFVQCCGPIIAGSKESSSAEELMRARYTAYTTGAVDFIIASNHPRTRHEANRESIRKWSETSTWRGLQILEAKPPSGDKANVLFEVRYSQGGQDILHREMSLFERTNGKWFFVSGKILNNPTVRHETPRPGRNEPCPCGSGKKFKKCCLMSALPN